MIADKNSYPLLDVLLIFTDYNTAVEERAGERAVRVPLVPRRAEQAVEDLPRR